MTTKNSLEQKRKKIIQKETKRWINSKLLNEMLEKKLRVKVLMEEKLKDEEMKRKRLLELLSIKY